MTITFIIIAVVAVIVVFVISAYNNLVKLRNNRENAFADIDVQLKQRFDLVGHSEGLCRTREGFVGEHHRSPHCRCERFEH